MGWRVSKKEKSYFCDGFVAFSLALGQKSQKRPCHSFRKILNLS